MLNLKLALRGLRRRPLLALVAVGSLTLGIGATTALFSVVQGLLVRPLPVAEPDGLINLSAGEGPTPGMISCGLAGPCDAVFSGPMFRDLEASDVVSVEGLAAHRFFQVNIGTDGGTRSGSGLYVSGRYFPLLALAPHLGRLLGPSDDGAPGEGTAAVVSHDFWRSRMGSDSNAAGTSIRLNGRSFEIVGVAPESFRGTTLGEAPDVFVPLSARPLLEPDAGGLEDRQAHWLYVFGRRAPGSEVDEVAADLNAVYARLLNEFEVPIAADLDADALESLRTKRMEVAPGARGQSYYVSGGGSTNQILLLFGVTAVVLLIACANVANLLLTRAVTRRDEMAIRGSLGARPRDLAGQLLTEAGVLAGLAVALGVLLSGWLLLALSRVVPADAAWMFDVGMSPSVLAFAVGSGFVTALLFGLYPALFGARTDLAPLIRGGSGHTSPGRAGARFRSTVVVGQLTLCCVLLVGAGLFARSLGNIARQELGMSTERVATFRVSPVRNGYEPEEARVFYQELQERLSAIPGVAGVSTATIPVLAGGVMRQMIAVEGFEPVPGEPTVPQMNRVGPDYFRTLGIPLLAGREFTGADHAAAASVAIVNESFTRAYGLDGAEAVGRRLGRPGRDGAGPELDVTIVGVVADAVHTGATSEEEATFFRPVAQQESPGDLSVYLRSSTEPEAILGSIPSVLAGIDPDLPVENLRTLEQQLAANVARERFMGRFMAAFAVVAGLLAVIGVYGVLAFAVAQRTREFGLRIALGAEAASIRRSVLRSVLGTIVLAGVLGLAGSVMLGRTLQSLLFEVSPADPAVLAVAVIALSIIALVAAWIPARRASRIDPMDALRWE